MFTDTFHDTPTHSVIQVEPPARPSSQAFRDSIMSPDGRAPPPTEQVSVCGDGVEHERKLESNTSKHSYGASDTSESLSTDEKSRIGKKAMLKIDLLMLPLMGLIVMLQYLDKAILSYAALLGLQRDLGLSNHEYSWAASIYFFGLLASLPMWTLLLQRITTDLVIGSAILIWGAIAMCHAATHNYAQILAVRFLLGFFEAAITPAFIICIGQFYTERETISRTAFWYMFNGIAFIVGGGMSYGLLTNPGSLASSLAIWRQLYLILGGITVFVGLVAIVLLPSKPERAWILSGDERKIVSARVQTRPGQQASTFFDRKVWKQTLEAVRDPRLYIVFVGLLLGSIPNGGITARVSQLNAGFGFAISQSLLLTMALGGAQIVSVLLFVITSHLAKSRAIGGITVLVIAIAGAALMYSPDANRAGHEVGLVLINFGSPAVVAIYSFTSAAVGGHGKRVAMATTAQLAYGAGNIIGPFTYIDSEAPVWASAKIVIIASLCGALCALASILVLHITWNRKREADLRSAPSSTVGLYEAAQQEDPRGHRVDTDFTDKSYRYVY